MNDEFTSPGRNRQPMVAVYCHPRSTVSQSDAVPTLIALICRVSVEHVFIRACWQPPCCCFLRVVQYVEDKMSDNDSESVPEPGHSRKRLRYEKQWKVSAAKMKRNMGEEYVSRHSKMLVPARKMGEKSNCWCFEKIGEEKVKDIFKAFGAISDFNQQNEYISKIVRSEEAKHSRVKDRPSRTLRRIAYSVTFDSTVYPVCCILTL